MIWNSMIHNIMRNCKELQHFGVSSPHVMSMSIKDLVEELSYLMVLGISILMKDHWLMNSIIQVGVDVQFTLECIGDCQYAISDKIEIN